MVNGTRKFFKLPWVDTLINKMDALAMKVCFT